MLGECRLCKQTTNLLNSHIIPAFAFRELKEHSGTGHIRFSENPNLRVQDGAKERWLCSSCEARFSAWERDFCNHLTAPLNDGAASVRYGAWLLKFCTSVSWRVLHYCKGRNPDVTYTAEEEEAVRSAEARWREYLLGLAPHPGKFVQHLLSFGILSSTTFDDLPDNFNRFMSGAVMMDIVGGQTSLMTWAKMGDIQIFGIIREGHQKFEGTKVLGNEGLFPCKRVVLPLGLMDLYREKAAHVGGVSEKISDIQSSKIAAALEQNWERYEQSRHFQALKADAALRNWRNS